MTKPDAPVVKGLEWTSHGSSLQSAETGFGKYRAFKGGWWFDPDHVGVASDIEAAKAACQADYERRILSALVEAPAKANAPVALADVTPDAWRWTGPRGGWIYDDERPIRWHSDPVYTRPTVEALLAAATERAEKAERARDTLRAEMDSKEPWAANVKLNHEVGSWRRVAERLEGEKTAALRERDEAREELAKVRGELGRVRRWMCDYQTELNAEYLSDFVKGKITALGYLGQLFDEFDDRAALTRTGDSTPPREAGDRSEQP